jgi:anti-anti-sigma factor
MSNEQVKITIQEEDSISIIYVSGELTLLDAPELKKYVDEIIAKGKKILLFDFENLTFLDSSGVGLLLRFNAQLSKTGGKIAFINFLHKSVANTMLKALPQHLRDSSYFDTMENAITYLKR